MYKIIANAASGKGAGKKCLEIVESVLKENSIEYKTDFIDGHGSGRALAQKACSEGAGVVIAIGGDGTFHEVLNGMDFTDNRLALIPAGRGNDYASACGISFDPKKALEPVLRGEIQDRDYIQLTDRRCLNVAGTGLDVEVLKLTEKKQGTYSASLAKLLLKYKPYTVRIEEGGRTQEHKCIMAALCNGSQFGGGIKLCPPAENADGKLDLMIVKQPGIPTIMVMPKFVAGRHMNCSWVEHIVCDKAKIIAEAGASIEIDGEIYNENILDGHIVAGGFKTFAAASASL